MKYLFEGIDVSSNNVVTDWVKVAKSINFAMIKVSEGRTYKDKMAAVYAAGAHVAGIKIGYYHFASLNNSVDILGDARGEAETFWGIVRQLPLSNLGYALDVETDEAKLTPVRVVAWVTAFIERLVELSNCNASDIMLYSGKYFLDAHLPADHKLGAFKLWLAAYPLNPDEYIVKLPIGWKDHHIWQWTDKGVVEGITGYVDRNRSI